MTGDLLVLLNARLAGVCGQILDVAEFPLGHRNRVWRVVTDAGVLAVKTTRRGEDALRWVADLIGLAHHLGLAAPALIPGADGALAASGLTVERWVDGHPATEADLESLRPRVSALHRKTAHWPQRPGFVAAADAGLKSAGGDLDMTALPPDLSALCLDAWSALDRRRAAIHGDLRHANVLLTPDGPVLLDWDEARCDHPALETTDPTETAARARLAWEVASGWRLEPDHAARMARRLGWRDPG